MFKVGNIVACINVPKDSGVVKLDTRQLYKVTEVEDMLDGNQSVCLMMHPSGGFVGYWKDSRFKLVREA